MCDVVQCHSALQQEVACNIVGGAKNVLDTVDYMTSLLSHTV
jgi:hypothetical protein